MEKNLMDILRKSWMIPAAVGLLASPALMAADISTPSTTRTFSAEYLDTANATDEVLAGALRVELGAEYTVDDIITLTFSGNALDPSSLPTSITVAPNSPLKGITLGLLNADAGTALYRVTALDGPSDDTTVGIIVPIAGENVLQFDAQALAAAGIVTVSFSAETNNGLDLDTGGGDNRVHPYLSVVTQYVSELIRTLNGVVDVETERTLFTPADDGTDFDVLSFRTREVVPLFQAATFVEVTYILQGNFGWIFDTDTNTPGIQPAEGVIGIGGECTLGDVDSSSIEVSCDELGSTDVVFDVTANVDADNNLATLPATGFTLTAFVDYDGFGNAPSPEGSTITLNQAFAGEWTLNGFQALVPYMPYGNGLSQIIYLANRGLQSGAVTVDAIDQNGNTYSLGEVATLGPQSTLSLATAIRNALPAALQASGRLALTITANVPADDVQINTAYNANGGTDRGFVSSETNRGSGTPD
jgi:hypothetical protein